MKGIVRKGDSTTHGGTVLEGIPNFLVHGVPVAGIGHMVFCPKCKGAAIRHKPCRTNREAILACIGMALACTFGCHRVK
ncbi:PAAR domain-containing protein [Cupriavidus sp. L7L]|uniref:PAAR domain-containing protein n=1 Tax=Cupriavidus sp. L7L TaxID=2546443 RepID=UPI0010546356|nr:PAAR domain-containing protein [Cupriavidus sp. L7L]TDF63354.1 PAAR domain-containing protein [Cupriavidus sp. L7L]